MTLMATFIHWSAGDIPLFILLGVLLVLSGCFSSSETALFGLTHAQRLELRRRRTIAGRAVDALLTDPRMLLITILLCNMLINVLYFVGSSVLLIRAQAPLWGQAIGGVLFLLLLVTCGEVVPKVLANANRIQFVRWLAPPLLTLHRFIKPIRVAVNVWIITPLNRLTAPVESPPDLNEDELQALLEISGQQGVINTDEQRGLEEVLNLSRMRVRDVMTPRVKMVAVEDNLSHEEILQTISSSRLTRLPVFHEDIDHIIGSLSVKDFLARDDAGDPDLTKSLQPIRYVPEISTLDQLLEHLRESGSKIAIAVDEYGGTAGIVSIEDIVEELVGDISTEGEPSKTPPLLVEEGVWRVSGGLSIRDWPEVLGHVIWRTNVVTLGGLIFDQLGRAPHVGDTVQINNISITVEEVEGHRVSSALVRMVNSDSNEEETA